LGSRSEVTNNPRTFVWYSQKNTLFLPVTLSDRDNSYRNTYAWQGILALFISPEEGIVPQGEISHIMIDDIDERIEKDCKKYEKASTKPVCRSLRSGQQICEYPDV